MPNRILKESICVSDSIDKLSWFEEVLFYRLIVNCDDYGRFDGRTAVIKNRLFPLKDSLTLGTVKAAIQKLVSAGLVITYESMGKPYLYLPTWLAHQSARAKNSKYPAPDSGSFPSDSGAKSSEIICKQTQADVPVFDIRDSYSKFDIRESENAPACEAAASAAPAQSGPPGCAVKSTPVFRLADPRIASVFTAYDGKIAARSPLTENIRDKLLVFLDTMGPECCIRAMDEAVEMGKISWRYVETVLKNKQSQGVRCLADWDALEEKRSSKKTDKPWVYDPGSMEGSL